jgi:nucleoside-diphosphate-sugar epimerase
MPTIARILVSVSAAAASASAFSTLPPRPLATAPVRSSCTRAARSPATFMSSSSLSEGDTVVVVGATGRIGKLVADKLLESDNKYRVRLIANNAAMAEEYVGTGAEAIFVGGLGRVPADETPTLLDISRKGMGECVNTQIANTHMHTYIHTHTHTHTTYSHARTHAPTHTHTYQYTQKLYLYRPLS